MRKLVRSNILNVKQYVPGKPIEEVQRELGLKEVIKLASNENCMGPSPKALSAIRGVLPDINRYPDAASFALRRKLAKLLRVKGDNLIFGNGSDEVICMAVRAFVGPKDEVVIAKPTFLIYEIVSQLNDARVKTVPLTGELKYDLKAMKDAITKRTKIVFIANPDNPAGTYVSKLELDGFFRDLPRNVIVFLDEAYFEFANHMYRDYPNGLDYIKRPGVIAARSFSKAYGLAGLRIGYGVASPEIIGYMERTREPFNVNMLAQAGALAALDDKKFLKGTVSHVAKEMRYMRQALKDIGLDSPKSATNFILVDVGCDCKYVFNELLKRGVIVRDMKAWGMDTYIRVTVGRRTENNKFLKALKSIIT